MEFELYDNEDILKNMKITIPKKTKQIGDIDPHVKIYIEDYVYTYLYQYAKSQISQEKFALLVGKHTVIDGLDIIIVSGAIRGKFSEKVNGIETFTEKTWEYIGNQMETYFKGMITVGWVHILSGADGFFTNEDLVFHNEYFHNSWQQAFMIDPIEKIDCFYSYTKQNGIQQSKGYFIYYDKNQEMQEYMLENTVLKRKFSSQERLSESIPNPTKELPPLPRYSTTTEREDPVQNMRKILKKRASEIELAEKKRQNILIAMSCILCCISLCTSLLVGNSMQRLKILEGEFSTYIQPNPSKSNDVQAVFSSTNQISTLPENSILTQASSSNASTTPTSNTTVNTTNIPDDTISNSSSTIDTTNTSSSSSSDTIVKESVEEVIEEIIIPTSTSINWYYVQEGDTLAKISLQHYGTTTEIINIMAENNITNADKIILGQKLRLP